MTKRLISPAELAKLLPAKETKVLDATWYLPTPANIGKNAKENFLKKRIPGASYFDIDGVNTPSRFPHMLPSEATFEKELTTLGITSQAPVVVYDTQGIFSGPRLVWTFKVFGHDNVQFLNSFEEYKQLSGIPSRPDAYKWGIWDTQVPGKTDPADPPYKVTKSRPHVVKSFEDILAIVDKHNGDAKAIRNDVTFIDARPNGRFKGTDPEPRAELSSGHVPGAYSVAFPEVVSDGKFKSPEELRALFASKGIDGSKPIVSMCGSGVTACVIDLALELAGIGSKDTNAVYDGSWTEWTQRAPEKYIVKEENFNEANRA